MIGASMTVAFFGASTGIGLAALKHTLAAGHQCIALCRTPSRLTANFSTDTPSNLKIVEGNAHDIDDVSRCLRGDDGKLVDVVVSTIGARFYLSKMKTDDMKTCQKAAATLVDAIAQLRRNGSPGNPHLIAVSSTGISRFSRDIPLSIVPAYHVLLKVPHEDKLAMEDRFMASQEDYTIVRAAWLTNGESTKEIRVGIEDPRLGQESKAIGYTISREDAGRWIAENLVLKRDARYLNKVASIMY